LRLIAFAPPKNPPHYFFWSFWFSQSPYDNPRGLFPVRTLAFTFSLPRSRLIPLNFLTSFFFNGCAPAPVLLPPPPYRAFFLFPLIGFRTCFSLRNDFCWLSTVTIWFLVFPFPPPKCFTFPPLGPFFDSSNLSHPAPVPFSSNSLAPQSPITARTLLPSEAFFYNSASGVLSFISKSSNFFVLASSYLFSLRPSVLLRSLPHLL